MVACVGGGSNALGFFYPFLGDAGVRMIGVKRAGWACSQRRSRGQPGAGCPGVLHGCHSYYLQDEDGQIINAHSISAGLDYPGVGPEHALLHDRKRVDYVSVTDAQAVSAFRWLTRRRASCRR